MSKLEIILFISLFVSTLVSSQGIIEAEGDITANFGNGLQRLNYFSQQSIEAMSTQLSNVANAGVFINQIGDDNTSIVNTFSNNTDIQLNQFGNANKIDLVLKADNISYRASQKGNNNMLLEYNAFENKQLLQREVLQNGSNQSLIIHGQNSIIDKMKITMADGPQSIIIRNTN